MVHAGVGRRWAHPSAGQDEHPEDGNLIEYEDEDPAVSEMFEAESKKAGVSNRMKL